MVFRLLNDVDSAFAAFEAQSRGLHALCVRFAAGVTPGATAVPKMPVDGRCEDVIFFDGVFFEPSLTSIFFAP